MQVDSIQERSGDLRQVSLNYGSGAAAFAGRVTEEATRASVQVTTGTFGERTRSELEDRLTSCYPYLEGLPGSLQS